MSCIIQLTYKAKRSLSQNPNRYLPHKFMLPKLFVEKQRAISFDRCTQNKKLIQNSPKLLTQSPKIIAKSAQTDFHYLKLSQCSKQSVLIEAKQFKIIQQIENSNNYQQIQMSFVMLVLKILRQNLMILLQKLILKDNDIVLFNFDIIFKYCYYIDFSNKMLLYLHFSIIYNQNISQ